LKALLTDYAFPFAQMAGVVVLIVGVVVYAVMLFRSWLVVTFPFREEIKANPGYLVGLPCSAVAAFGIVSMLEISAGKLEFKAFNLDFTGPAGPVTLWVLCYLTLVGSIRMVGHSNQQAKGSAIAK
jgi:hypothetical protein